MTSLSHAQGGPRPADLPPTLQPHAIAAMAPATNKRLTAALSVLTYAFLGSGLALAAAVKTGVVENRYKTDGPVIDIREKPVEPLETRLVNTPPAALIQKGDGTRPKDVEPQESVQPQSQPQATDVIPNRMPTDQSGSGPYTKDMPEGTGLGGHKNGSDRADASRTGSPDGKLGATGTGPVSVDASAVSIRSQVQPNYPQMARLTHIQGPVVLKMTIDAQGVPTDVQMVSGNPVFQAEAVRAARLWRFTPAMVGGQPVAAVFNLTINFTLRS